MSEFPAKTRFSREEALEFAVRFRLNVTDVLGNVIEGRQEAYDRLTAIIQHLDAQPAPAVGAESLPAHLRDPLKVMERGRELTANDDALLKLRLRETFVGEDSARLGWLEARGHMVTQRLDGSYYWTIAFGTPTDCNTLREAIDAARLGSEARP